MNNGFFSFPTQQLTSSTVLDIKEFDSSGTYTIPVGAKRLWIMLIGAGSGGGGGRRSAVNVAAFGGGGGGGGNINTAYYWVESLAISGEVAGGPGTAAVRPGSAGKTLTIVLGAGGTAGAKATGDSTNGGDGGRGGDSFIRVTGTTGNMMYSYGGATYGTPFGTGGTISSGLGGTPTAVCGWPMINGIASGNLTTTYSQNGANAGTSITHFGGFSNNGGAGGGLISGANAGTAGGGISINTATVSPMVLNPYWNLTSAVLKAGGATDGGTPSFEALTMGPYRPGLGGVGGGPGLTVAAGNGTNGYRGGGGGGGGGSRNGLAAGDGGVGGDGYCVIIALG